MLKRSILQEPDLAESYCMETEERGRVVGMKRAREAGKERKRKGRTERKRGE